MQNKIKNDRLRAKAFNWMYAILRFIIIFGLGFIIVKPLLAKVLLSFMSPEDLLDNTVKLIPKTPSLYYWKKMLEQILLPKSLINSVLLSLLVAIVQTAACTVIGYGLARFKFKGSGLAFAFVIIMMIVPYQAINIAQYQSFVNLSIFGIELVDTFWPILILAFTGLGIREGLYIYLMRENFKSLSNTLEEAAYIDGAGVFKTFWAVMLPNARTMMTTVFLFSFCWEWTDTVYPKTYLVDTPLLATAVSTVSVRNDLAWDNIGTQMAQCAASLFVAIPLIFLFVLCQRSFVKSISQTGLSGG